MVTTIQQAFQTLKSNVEITTLQKETTATRQAAVRSALDNGLAVNETFLTGSYARNTMIAPLKEADVDIFAVLDDKYFYNYNGQNGGPAGLLDLVKRTLKKTYTQTPDISRNGQAVTIIFNDFQVDVVPAFYRQGGGFLIPCSITQAWISTDPKKHVELVSSSNQAHNGDLIPLIKMIKAWNKSHSSFFRSFHLEVLVLSILENVRISSFPSGVRYYFGKAAGLIVQKNLDPAGYGGDIGGYLNTQEKINAAITKLQNAYNTALEAEGFESKGYTEHAFGKWQKIFGDYFPAYR